MHDTQMIAADARAFRHAVHKGQPYKPLYVKFKLMWACNLRCVMCRHWREVRAPALGLDFYRGLVDELGLLGGRKIHLTGGEPTLRPDLESLIAHIRERGMYATMTSNATLIDGPRAMSLIQAGLKKINISLDSPSPETHDRIRGQEGAWKKTVSALQHLRPWMKPGGLQINTVIGGQNYRELKKFPDLLIKLGVDRWNLIPVDPYTSEAECLNLAQVEEYNREIAPVLKEKALEAGLIQEPAQIYPFGETIEEITQGLEGRYARNYYRHSPCFAPWTHALVDHRGLVSTCCMTPNKPILGDLNQQSFHEIWHGPAFAALRNIRQTPLFDACLQCDMFLTNNRRLSRLLQNPALRWWERLTRWRMP